MKPTRILGSAAVVLAFVQMVGCGVETTTSRPLPAGPPANVPASNPPSNITASPESDGGPDVPQKVEAAGVAEDEEKGGDAKAEAATAPTGANLPHAANGVDIVRVIDLRTFPKLNPQREFEQKATYFYYSGKSSVAAADAFHQAELRTRKWNMISPESSTTDQYSDRLYERDGYYLRVSIGASGDEGEVGIGLSSLGNYDMKVLPRIAGAKLNDASTSVNVAYTSTESLAQIATFCRESFPALGWHEYTGIEATGVDVPHVKTLTFMQHGVRMMVSIARQPQNVTEPPIVAYFLEAAMPFDVPLVDDAQELQIDWYLGRARYRSQQTVANVVEQLRKAGQRLGWKEHSESSVSSDSSATLFVEDDPDFGFGVSVYSDKGTTRVAFERITFKKSAEPDGATDADPALADAAEMPNESPANETAAEIESATDEIDKAVADAMNKAKSDIDGQLDDINKELRKSGIDIDIKGLSKLVGDDAEDAADLAEALAGDDDETDGDALAADESASGDDDTNAGELRFADVHLGTGKGRIEYQGASYELQHAMAYQVTKDGDATTVIIMSDKPLRVAKAKGKVEEDLSMFDLEDSNADARMELRIRDGYSQANCQLKSSSLSFGINELDNKTEVVDGKLRGTLGVKEPVEIFDEKIQFQVKLDIKLSTLTSATVPQGPVELVADSQYEYPVPEGCSSVSREGTRYRSEVTATIKAPVADVIKFYQQTLTAGGWREVVAKGAQPKGSTTLKYTGGKGPIAVTLTGTGDETSIALEFRDDAKAKADGVVPAAGKAYIILGNATEEEVVFVIGSKQHRLKAEEGASDPSKAVRVEVAPGKHMVTIQKNGMKLQSEEVTVGADTTWGAIAIPGGEIFANRVY